ncbi:MAG: aldo/keto reductase [Anaerolineales bacterium]|nr:aldo/keto reductase [Anaerolineales bacterium]
MHYRKATVTGTAAYKQSHPQLNYRQFGRTDLQVSQAGFGGYRIDVGAENHRAALRHALTNGINLIDTSSNYADGGSEKLIGAVLAELFAAGQLERSQVVVVSKVGYLQGQNYALSQQRKAAERPFPDLVEYSNGLEHCIHPEFIADQLTRTLERLQLETVDCYLLHNPEYFLGWAKKFDYELEEVRQIYDERLELAFQYLEEEVANGRIQSYGVSSNSFPHAAASYDFTSVERLWEIATAISPDHHFSAIQLPFNLLETGAATEQNQSHGRTVLAFAQEKQLAVLINRPLNAIDGHNLTRLASVPMVETPAVSAEIQTAVEEVAALEDQLQQEIFALSLPFRTQQEFAATLAAARLLKQRWAGIGSLNNWQDVRDGYVRPRAQMGLQFLHQRPESSDKMRTLGDAYEAALEKALSQITHYYQADAAAVAKQILARAHAAAPEWQAPTLSQTAVRALRTTAAVTSVLVGMRRVEYVDDVLEELRRPEQRADFTAAWQTLAQSR